MGNKRLLSCIGLPDLEHGLIDVDYLEADHDFYADISMVRISMIRDVHDESIELKVLFYDQDNEEEDPPVLEFWVDPEGIAPLDELAEIGIKPTQLRHLFSQDIQGILLALDIQILWFCEDGYWLPLNLFDEDDNGVRLEVVDQ